MSSVFLVLLAIYYVESPTLFSTVKFLEEFKIIP